MAQSALLRRAPAGAAALQAPLRQEKREETKATPPVAMMAHTGAEALRRESAPTVKELMDAAEELYQNANGAA